MNDVEHIIVIPHKNNNAECCYSNIIFLHVLLLCISALPGHLLLQVSHQMIQRGHHKAVQSTIYHGNYQGYPHILHKQEIIPRAFSSHDEYEQPLSAPIKEYKLPPIPNNNFAPPHILPEEYGPPPVSLEEYGPPPVPNEKYGPPLESMELFEPLPAPNKDHGPPPTPIREYGASPTPTKEYRPHLVPIEKYEPLPVSIEEHGHPLSPIEEYGPSAVPIEEHEPPQILIEEQGPPSAPIEEHGSPHAPIENQESLVVKQYIPHKIFTHFVNPVTTIYKSETVAVNQPSLAPPKHFVFHNPNIAPPLPVHPSPSYPDEPPVYKYSYSVDDDYTGTLINVDEARDAKHTKGSYKVKLKDGRQQSVVYTSDEYGGYKATVEYSDKNTRVDQARNEDNTHGSYQVTLADGRHQSVEYTADHQGGYKAKVEYRDKYSSYSRS